MKLKVGTTAVCLMIAWLSGVSEADMETVQIVASEDDAFCTVSSVNYPSTTLYWPYASTARRSFLRWVCNIPQGATIVEASVQVKALAAGAGTTTLQVQAVDSNNCPDFTSNPWSLAVAGPAVDWALSDVVKDSWYTSPDLSGLLQEYINRDGYAPGNYFGLRSAWVSGVAHRTIYPWDGTVHTNGAKLLVTYITTNSPPVAHAGSDRYIQDQDGNGSESVTLDGSLSSDRNGLISSYVWTEGGSQIATGATPSVTLPIGVHTITLTVADAEGETGSDTVVITIAEQGSAPLERVVAFQVIASTDDAATDSRETGEGFETMYWPYTTTSRLTFLRWRSLIPKGATITEAYVKVMGAGGSLGSDPSAVRLQVVDSGNAPTFLRDDNPFLSAVMTNYVDSVVPGDWAEGTWHATTNIRSIVQAYIDRPDYAYGNHIGIRGSIASGLWKTAYTWDFGDHSAAPQLEVHYTGGEFVLQLWMADPETRLGQKVYCQMANPGSNDTLRVKLDGNVVYTKAAPLSSSEEVFSVDYRGLGAGSHTLLVEALDKNGTVLGSTQRTWTKLHEGIAAAAIDENNAICRDGVPFFPITPWVLKPTELESGLWDEQINTMCGQTFNLEKSLDGWRSYIQLAEEYNHALMGPAIGDYWPGGYTDNDVDIDGVHVYFKDLDLDRVTEYIQASKTSSSMLMYIWHDEPDLGGADEYIPATAVRRWTDHSHALDTERLHYLNIVGYSFTGAPPYPNYNNQRVQSYCFLNDDQQTIAMGTNAPFADRTLVADVLSFDYYPYERALWPSTIKWIGLPDLAVAIDRLREWNYNLAPTMTWVETCDIGEDQSPPVPAPTPTQLKNLVWLSIIHEVKGIQWFHYFGVTPTENRAVMKTATEWITTLAQPILSAPENVSWTVTDQELGGEQVDMLTREVDGQLYIFATHLIKNGLGETVRFNMPGLPSGASVGVLGENRLITAGDGYFEDAFSPLAVHIYTYPAMTNFPPAVNAGRAQVLTDADGDGFEIVTLADAGSLDADGTLVDYVWMEGATPLATGTTAQVSLPIGLHKITLAVTDNTGATGSNIVYVTVKPLTNDRDGDGLPDSWEQQYFGDATNANPTAMASNGVNTLVEAYIAGLNPTNAQSLFTLFGQLSIAPSQLQWSAVSGRVYSVSWTTNLLNSFQPLETNIVWPQNSWTDLVQGVHDEGFYRVEVQLEQ